MRRLALDVFLVGLCSCAVADTSHTLIVNDAWIPEGPPTSLMVAVYFDVENLGDQHRRLLRARRGDGTPAAIHRSMERNGVARMSSLDELVIEPGQRVRFAPGGYHLMLNAKPGDYRAGQLVDLELHFADGSVIPFQAKVWRRHERNAVDRNRDHEH